MPMNDGNPFFNNYATIAEPPRGEDNPYHKEVEDGGAYFEGLTTIKMVDLFELSPNLFYFVPEGSPIHKMAQAFESHGELPISDFNQINLDSLPHGFYDQYGITGIECTGTHIRGMYGNAPGFFENLMKIQEGFAEVDDYIFGRSNDQPEMAPTDGEQSEGVPTPRQQDESGRSTVEGDI